MDGILGVEFKDEVGTATGALWQRSHYPVTPSGNSYIRVFQGILEGNDKVQILYATTAKELVAENGAVTGVVAEGKDGQKVTLHANKGVILPPAALARTRKCWRNTTPACGPMSILTALG